MLNTPTLGFTRQLQLWVHLAVLRKIDPQRNPILLLLPRGDVLAVLAAYVEHPDDPHVSYAVLLLNK